MGQPHFSKNWGTSRLSPDFVPRISSSPDFVPGFPVPGFPPDLSSPDLSVPGFVPPDLSREGNAGPGAVDFRFTVGHDARLLVEVKLSTHERLKNGYYEQLPAYAIAETVKRLILLVVRVSTNDSHLTSLIESIKKKSLPIQLVVIDALPKPSASKRSYRDTT